MKLANGLTVLSCVDTADDWWSRGHDGSGAGPGYDGELIHQALAKVIRSANEWLVENEVVEVQSVDQQESVLVCEIHIPRKTIP